MLVALARLNPRRVTPLVTLAGLLVVIAVVAGAMASPAREPDQDPVPASGSAAPMVVEDVVDPNLSRCPPFCGSAERSAVLETIVTIVVVLGAILATAFVLYLLWMLIDRLRQITLRIPPDWRDDDGAGEAFAVAVPAVERVEEALDAGLEALSDLDGDPRRAVIACWVSLEQAAARAEIPRDPGDTPAELVSRLLSHYPVDSVTLDEFARVYRVARYATCPVDTSMREVARLALERVRAELREPV